MGCVARKLRSVVRMMRDRGFATLHDMLSTFGQSGARVLWDERFAVAGLGGFENTSASSRHGSARCGGVEVAVPVCS